MRTKNRLLLTAIGAAALFTACDVKDPIYETEHPDKAQITITADWSGMGMGIPRPESYMAEVNGTAYADIPTTPDSHTFPDVDPGTCTAYLYNKVSNLPVANKTATVATIPAPAGQTGAWLDPQPGWLFTGRLQETVEADKDYAFTVPMKQQVRQLTLVIEPMGGTADKIESIMASLSGLAGSLDLDNDAHDAPANVALTFSKITTGDNTGKWTATVRLLGIAGSEQKLSGTIKFTGGSPGDIPLTSDLSAALANFNADKKTPLTLGGTTVETPTGAGFTVTINGWTPVDGGTGIAN
jgi:hypothetical protein